MKVTHGKTGSSIYAVWSGMMQRCGNKNHKQYPFYGDRGIKVCERWLNFENFYADMGDRPKDKSIDRIDNNKGYSPENCRWATRTEQTRNRSITIKAKINGVEKTLGEWCEHFDVRYSTYFNRRRRGYSLIDALSSENPKPKVNQNDINEIRKMVENNVPQSEIAKKFCIDQSYVSQLKRGLIPRGLKW